MRKSHETVWFSFLSPPNAPVWTGQRLCPWWTFQFEQSYNAFSSSGDTWSFRVCESRIPTPGLTSCCLDPCFILIFAKFSIKFLCLLREASSRSWEQYRTKVLVRKSCVVSRGRIRYWRAHLNDSCLFGDQSPTLDGVELFSGSKDSTSFLGGRL